MELTEILEEISVGFRSHKEKSQKLNNYVNLVREALEEHGALYENEVITVEKFDIEKDESGDTFIQGSYGTHTAIKHPSYDVDADIGLILNDINTRLDIREKIYFQLKRKFPNYNVELKKPCITIDFKDGYKIDVAIYSRHNDEIWFHNSIQGTETITRAKPKELIRFFNDRYSEDNIKRSVVRLVKHFIKIASDTLEIDEKNKIPSIATNLIIVDKNLKEYGSVEETLFYNIGYVVDEFINYVESNGYSGPSLESLCVGNTFYKVENINEVIDVLKKVQINLKNKQYSELIGNSVFSKIYEKHKIKFNTSPMGTLGEKDE